MGGKIMLMEDGKYSVTFSVYGQRTDADVNRFVKAMSDFFTKFDARDVKGVGSSGPKVAAQKAKSKKWEK